MAELILNVFVDGLMVLLLLITIYYCWKLNKRIQVLQDSRSELAAIIKQFDESTQMATRSIGDIHKATQRLSENMQHKIDKANYLADDLQFMIEKGNKIADRMDGGISSNRKAAPQPQRASEPSAAATEAVRAARRQQAPRAEAQEEAPRRAARSEPSGGADAAKASLESVLKRVQNRDAKTTATEAADAKGRRPTARLRSKSEQELFDALKGVNEA